MPDKDFYPASMDALDAWHANFYDQLKNHGFAAKYGIDGAIVDAFKVIADWFAYWVALRHSQDNFSQELTKYFNTIKGNVATAPLPDNPVFTPSGGPPATPATGIEKLTRDTAREIKNRSIYSAADGEAMGIETAGQGPSSPDQMKPVIALTTRQAFEVGVKFKKQGMSAIRVEYRHKGGQWLSGGVLLNSPGSFAVAPATPGETEQIDVRAIFMQGNTNVGQWSDIVPVFIAP